MTNTISFITSGNLDLAALTTFGVTAKPNSNSPIGQFGTGLKYALAICARLHMDVTLKTNGKTYHLESTPSEFRGEPITKLWLNQGDGIPPIPLPFTTALGHHWKLWMAYRELYCNTLDENGKVIDHEPDPSAESKTVIIIKGAAFSECHRNRVKFTLTSAPLWDGADLSIHPAEGSPGIYYQNILVHQDAYCFRYNLKQPTELTEDRTLKHIFLAECDIRSALLGCSNEDVLHTTIPCGDSCREYHFPWDCGQTPGGTFTEVFDSHKKDILLVAPSLRAFMAHHNPDLNFFEAFTPTSVQTRMLEKARQILETYGLFEDRYEIKLIETAGNGVLGMARPKQGIIYLTKAAFDQGTKRLAGTLYEEYLHCHYNYLDHTRELQDHLIDTLMTQVELTANSPM